MTETAHSGSLLKGSSRSARWRQGRAGGSACRLVFQQLRRARANAIGRQLDCPCPSRLRLCWRRALDVYLIDGTYELFRHYYALPSVRDQAGHEVAAVRGVLASVLGMIKGGATHLAVATDHVIESFRNNLWPGYKTGEGVDPDLLAQFPLLEDVLSAAGVVVWPMVEFEADDALAAAAVASAEDARVERVIICTPDKDLAQC